MKLIVVSTETFFAQETTAVPALFEAGLEIFHLRKPHSTIEEMRDFLQKIPAQFHGRVVLHDHFSLLNEFALKGVHINRRTPVETWRAASLSTKMPHTETRRATSLHHHTSKSCHTLEEIKHISGFDYVFLSPIFDSISKNGYSKAFSHEELLQAKRAGIINGKVIALGGVTPENIPQVAEYGFGGVAILGGLWADFEITGDVQSLLERFNVYRTQMNGLLFTKKYSHP